MAAHPCVEVIVSCLVNLGVVQVACQQSASVTSDTGCSNYRLPVSALGCQSSVCMYAHILWGWIPTSSISQLQCNRLDGTSILGCSDSVGHPLVVAMIVMDASAAWREVEAAQFQWPWKAPQGDKRQSQAEIEIWVCGDVAVGCIARHNATWWILDLIWEISLCPVMHFSCLFIHIVQQPGADQVSYIMIAE